MMRPDVAQVRATFSIFPRIMYYTQAFLPVGQGFRGSRQDVGIHGEDRVSRAWPGLDLQLPLPIFHPGGVVEDAEEYPVEFDVYTTIMDSPDPVLMIRFIEIQPDTAIVFNGPLANCCPAAGSAGTASSRKTPVPQGGWTSIASWCNTFGLNR